MTIRSKLSIAMAAMFGALLVTAIVVVQAVETISAEALCHARMRELSVFTDDVRAEVFYRAAVAHGLSPLRGDEDWWPEDVLEDVGVRVNLSGSEAEKKAWMRVREAIGTLARQTAENEDTTPVIREADAQLRKLRRYYDRLVADAVADTAHAASNAQFVVVAAALASALLFCVMILLIRDWLVKPILILNQAADEIGTGNLDHRVPLEGCDELGQLARRLNTMASRLAEHQKQLLEAREMAAVGELCTNVAHGLRNPLAGMRAAAQLAGRRLDDAGKLRSTFDDIIEEIDRMDKRVAELFEFSRMSELKRQPTRFDELVSDAHAEARGVVDPKNIKVEMEDQTEGAVWPIDRAKLASAIGEFITNAAHHSDQGNTITVSGAVTRHPNGTPSNFHIAVIDHGRGIPKNVMNRLFDLFFTTRPNGTGMGLSLAQRIIQQHNGTVQISSHPGEGTRVDINLLGT